MICMAPTVTPRRHAAGPVSHSSALFLVKKSEIGIADGLYNCKYRIDHGSPLQDIFTVLKKIRKHFVNFEILYVDAQNDK